jgi:DNA-binding LytR/AlgR family response regulator
VKSFRYITIDDELLSHFTIHKHLSAHPNYTCLAAFTNPEEALIFLRRHKVDLIFLDIEMPEMNGFQFLEALRKNIFVVILTAYPDKYSLHAHHYIDKNLVFFSNKAQFLYYLPKIIARFEKMHKEKSIVDRMYRLSKNEIQTFPKKINNHPILLVDILMITVISHNVVLKMKNGEEIIFRMTLRELKNFLPASNFLHVTRNIIINILHVTAFTDTTVCLKNQHFCISARKRKEVLEILKTQRQELYKN